MISIVNVKRHGFKNVEYVGRKVGGQYAQYTHQSPLANPYKVNSESVRGWSLLQYELWLLKKLSEKDIAVKKEMNRLYLLAKKGNLVLGCWCAPKGCHAAIIAKYIQEALDKLDSKEEPKFKARGLKTYRAKKGDKHV